MAFKCVVFSALLAVASAGLLSPVPYGHPHGHGHAHGHGHGYAPVAVANPPVDTIASTHENVVRSYGGTVSHHSKTIDTPYASVHKEDTRVSNNVYAPSIAKAMSYAAPALYTHATPVHSAPVHAAYQQHQAATPTVYTHLAPVYAHSAPAAEAKTLSYAAPAPSPAPTHVYHHAVPQAHSTYNHSPAAATYSHQAPYGTSHTVHYSPAEMVSHMSFEGFGTHWGF